jgi:Uri superfamily endonuclease
VKLKTLRVLTKEYIPIGMVLRGSYCLCLEVTEDATVTVGALGPLTFKRGSYVYVGSAMNSLEPRVRRHLRTSEGLSGVTHWHIDYLLREPAAKIVRIYIGEGDEKRECLYAGRVAEHGEPVKGFGCSDCRCVSHLYRVRGFDFLEKMGLKRYC